MELIYKRPTRVEYGHTEVHHTGVYIGYFLPNRSPARRMGENWNFVSNHSSVRNVSASNRTLLIKLINDQLNPNYFE